MKREIFISKSNYKAVMDYIFECQRNNDYKNMINSTAANQKESIPFYELIDINFNYTSRIAKITFYKTVKYRTIEKYITRNYVKYPVYSSWKSKHSEIKKNIRLTNNDLENLLFNEDELIRKFAQEIVYKLNDYDLLPSWYLVEYYKNEFDSISYNLNNESSKTIENYNNQISEIENELILFNKTKNKTVKLLKKLNDKSNHVTRKIEAINTHNKNYFFCVITLGLYYYLTSDFRKEKLISKLNKIKISTEKTINFLNETTNSIQIDTNKISELNIKISETEASTLKKISDYKTIYDNRIKSIQPLQTDCNYASDDFVPLKSISAFNKERIIGCYIIKNTENGKCYVGQSKDVMKRLRQHFKGTEPINIIFAKDYFSSRYEKKEDIFEVKIIPCKTKDELDMTERKLIEEYGAREIGYNSTIGNK